jgi:hypothetical protein
MALQEINFCGTELKNIDIWEDSIYLNLCYITGYQQSS